MGFGRRQNVSIWLMEVNADAYFIHLSHIAIVPRIARSVVIHDLYVVDNV